ncbi:MULTISPECIES: phosphotransacetylase family protein [unclassified Haladaptatus]|uniref:phosphotransacetylase family protein n=1 Tax=unclassified Haladaptatus TaxID=2622732 RepID=UPI0023E7D8E3|nr:MULTISPECIES: phosphotransacetylase family protein [unclassified Haladaptatus]
MNTLLITATEESTGKTAIALSLATLAANQGKAVGYMKPKGTRLQSNVGKILDEDPMLARDLLDTDADVSEMEPIVYSPTFVESVLRGQENPDDLKARVRENFESLATDRDLMVVEGGGSYTTGGIVNLTDADVADLLDAKVVLVTTYSEPGDVDDVLAAADRFGDRLGGVLFNAVEDASYDRVSTDVVPFLEGRGIPVYGVLPRKRELAGISVADLAAELGAQIVTQNTPTDGFVERFVVGAMGPEAALSQFRRSKDAAMITGGDRTDIQTAALEASGIKCLLLTGGFSPPGAVIGKAESRGIPILLMQTDTMTTIERAEDVIRAGRTRDEETVESMRELLTAHVDVDALLG